MKNVVQLFLTLLERLTEVGMSGEGTPYRRNNDQVNTHSDSERERNYVMCAHMLLERGDYRPDYRMCSNFCGMKLLRFGSHA